jgi:hypothetical protein
MHIPCERGGDALLHVLIDQLHQTTIEWIVFVEYKLHCPILATGIVEQQFVHFDEFSQLLSARTTVQRR